MCSFAANLKLNIYKDARCAVYYVSKKKVASHVRRRMYANLSFGIQEGVRASDQTGWRNDCD